MIECVSEYQIAPSEKLISLKSSEEYNPNKSIEEYLAAFNGEIREKHGATFVNIVSLSVTENDEDGNRILSEFKNPVRTNIWP